MALVKCAECGKRISSVAVSCPSCGHPQETAIAAATMSPKGKMTLAIVCGVLLGGLVGFMARPAIPFVGQLPLGVVITAGANLQGFEQMLLPVARQSFSFLLLGALIGGAAGWVAGPFLAPSASPELSRQLKAWIDPYRPTTPPASAGRNCSNCGAKLAQDSSCRRCDKSPAPSTKEENQ